jgi:DNA-directed RNA polymerase I, II, and III subunit RPABC1
MVFFMNEEKTATATVRNVFEKIKAVDRVKCAVFVIRKMMVPQARKALTEGMRECRAPITVDVFTESELVVNVMKHELVPEHKILSPADKRELLRKYHVTEAQLPRILVTGSLCPHFALPPSACVTLTLPQIPCPSSSG